MGTKQVPVTGPVRTIKTVNQPIVHERRRTFSCAGCAPRERRGAEATGSLSAAASAASLPWDEAPLGGCFYSTLRTRNVSLKLQYDVSPRVYSIVAILQDYYVSNVLCNGFMFRSRRELFIKYI